MPILTEPSNPVSENNRIAILDILRGWALLGVVLMNYTDVYSYLSKPSNPGTLDNILMEIGGIVFSAKSWTLLSFLFGYGFAILIAHVSSKGVRPLLFFSKRMFWLLILAVINSAFFFGDILKDYAVMGMVLLLFRNFSAKRYFYFCLVLFIMNPFITPYFMKSNYNAVMAAMRYFPLYQSHNLLNIFKSGIMGTFEFELANSFYSVVVHEVILFCFLLGLAAQKINFFGNLQKNKRYILIIFWCSLFFAIVMHFQWQIVKALNLKNIYTYFQPFFWGIISTMLFLASTICLIYLSGRLARFFGYLQAFGKMTLTNYISQNILAVLLFSGLCFRLGALKLTYGFYMVIALLIYILQLIFSKWWLSKYNYGPVEWIWRQLSYGKKLPLVKQHEE